MHVIDRILERSRQLDSICVVGLDPNLELMPPCAVVGYDLSPAKWQPQLAQLFFDYNLRFIAAVEDLVAAVKLQAAYYEVLGASGMTCLERTAELCRAKGIPVILDAKRADIPTTSEAYARAYLRGGVVPGAPPAVAVDAMTVNPYLGGDSIAPFVSAANEFGNGVFVLVKTSNPGSKDFQDLVVDGGDTLAFRVAEMVDELGRDSIGVSGYSAIGAVVGATFPREAAQLRRAMPRTLFLVPGFGAQQGDRVDIAAFLNADGRGAIVSASRSAYYPRDRTVSFDALPDAWRKNVVMMNAAINDAVAAISGPAPRAP